MTAIEWYYEQTVIQGKTNYWELLEQAKQMEKQQIIDAHTHMRCIDNQTMDCTIKAYNNAEQYYNETYGKAE